MVEDFPHPPLDQQRLLRVLADHDVDYVLVGGLAAEAHGSMRATFDMDIVPASDDDNLNRLAAALVEVDGRIIHAVVDEGDAIELHVERPAWSAELLRDNPFLHVRTSAGDLDILLAPTGVPRGYEQLAPGSLTIRPHGVPVRLAALDDLIASKQAVGREKDLAVIEELQALRATPPAGTA